MHQKASNKRDIIFFIFLIMLKYGVLSIILLMITVSASMLSVDFGSKSIKAGLKAKGSIPTVVFSESGKRSIPNAISFVNGERRFGKSASDFFSSKPQYVTSVPFHLLGLKVNPEECNEDNVCKSPFNNDNDLNLIRLENDHFGIRLGSEDDSLDFSITSLVSMFLQHIIEQAEKQSESQVSDVVFNIPHSFTAYQEEYLIEMCESLQISVLAVPRMVSAASVQLFFSQKDSFNSNGTVGLLLDVGHKSTQVCVAKFKKSSSKKKLGSIKVLGCGHAHIGGSIVDEAILNLFPPEITNSMTVRTKQQLLKAAEKIKHVLSVNQQGHSSVYVSGKTYKLSVSREALYKSEALLDFRDTLMNTVKNVVNQANVSNEDIKMVIPLGGSLRVPILLNALEGEYGRLSAFINADESIATGGVLLGMREHPIFMINSFGFQEPALEDIYVSSDNESIGSVIFSSDKPSIPGVRSVVMNRDVDFSVNVGPVNGLSLICTISDFEKIIKLRESSLKDIVDNDEELIANVTALPKVRLTFQHAADGKIKLSSAVASFTLVKVNKTKTGLFKSEKIPIPYEARHNLEINCVSSKIFSEPSLSQNLELFNKADRLRHSISEKHNAIEKSIYRVRELEDSQGKINGQKKLQDQFTKLNKLLEKHNIDVINLPNLNKPLYDVVTEEKFQDILTQASEAEEFLLDFEYDYGYLLTGNNITKIVENLKIAENLYHNVSLQILKPFLKIQKSLDNIKLFAQIFSSFTSAYFEKELAFRNLTNKFETFEYNLTSTDKSSLETLINIFEIELNSTKTFLLGIFQKKNPFDFDQTNVMKRQKSFKKETKNYIVRIQAKFSEARSKHLKKIKREMELEEKLKNANANSTSFNETTNVNQTEFFNTSQSNSSKETNIDSETQFETDEPKIENEEEFSQEYTQDDDSFEFEFDQVVEDIEDNNNDEFCSFDDKDGCLSGENDHDEL
eukprot:TRINITY_DN645_c0_g1_i1.p1 TRINITY_DN645_c0_g1~~TRINITY_DN645_c0_g1_i1.p1  ORF type:complete len:964 (+),score=290.20 TRINITY_DN645_c0_g1_i1:366-3257(+)